MKLIMKKTIICALMGLATLAITSCGGSSEKSINANDSTKREAVELSGAGATFPLPFYNAVFEGYKNAVGDVVAYGGIGSGGGIRNLKDGIVDFAGSDAFLSDKEQSEMKPVVHIPTCMGAVVLAYNLQGFADLKLSGDVVADIFAGKITQWDDARIKELNPQATLPSQTIIPVYRSDGSGTTFVFTDYLSKVSKEWAEKYGTGKSVNFPAGQAAKGNPGVAGVISQTANSIGYVGSEYAFAQKIPYATLKNLNGEFVKPTAESISAAASDEIPADTRTMITNSAAQGAYPISCFTWIVVYKEQNYSNRSKEQAVATVELLEFILSQQAQAITAKVHYAPLPAKAIELSRNNLKSITYNGDTLKK